MIIGLLPLFSLLQEESFLKKFVFRTPIWRLGSQKPRFMCNIFWFMALWSVSPPIVACGCVHKTAPGPQTSLLTCLTSNYIPQDHSQAPGAVQSPFRAAQKWKRSKVWTENEKKCHFWPLKGTISIGRAIIPVFSPGFWPKSFGIRFIGPISQVPKQKLGIFGHTDEILGLWRKNC